MVLPGCRLRDLLLSGCEPEWLRRHSRRIYIINLVMSTPPWANRRAIAALKREARRRSKRDGVKWHVDHIVPLTHSRVCGLTVHWNMRVITGAENAARSNRWWEWTADLFDLPEQLRLL